MFTDVFDYLPLTALVDDQVSSEQKPVLEFDVCLCHSERYMQLHHLMFALCVDQVEKGIRTPDETECTRSGPK